VNNAKARTHPAKAAVVKKTPKVKPVKPAKMAHRPKGQ
jgi:hypothetical protein